MTNRAIMELVEKELEKMPEYQAVKQELDYFSIVGKYDETEIDHLERYRLIAYPNFGGSEGIYVDADFVPVDKDQRLIHGVTAKTLGTSLEDMRKMGELAGLITSAEDNVWRQLPEEAM
jgi:hypothetical protein